MQLYVGSCGDVRVSGRRLLRKRVGSGFMARFCLPATLVIVFGANVHAAAQKFPPVTAAELALKSVPGVENAPAVILRQEDVTDDIGGRVQHYERIKILNEAGLKYATISLKYIHTSDDNQDREIAARTVHPDGSVTMFTGKPHKRPIEKSKDFELDEAVITLPAVEVGSIVEYRSSDPYAYLQPPSWDLQGDLYVKESLHIWLPSQRVKDMDNHPLTVVSWLPVLPPGTQLEHNVRDANSILLDKSVLSNENYVVRANDIPPLPHEEMMPPESSVRYSVRFSYAAAGGAAAFWKAFAGQWSKRVERFAVQSPELEKATRELTAGAATQDAKLRKLYAAIMEMKNTESMREQSASELKAEGLAALPKTAADVWSRKQGDSLQLTELFVAMARAAGMKATFVAVSDRRDTLFEPSYLNGRQLTAELALVTVDGKDRLFDPGERYCEYGQLAWQHTNENALKLNGKDAEFLAIPPANAQLNRTSRVARLTVNEAGEFSGALEFSFTGAEALRWRTKALQGDSQELQEAVRKDLGAPLEGDISIEDVRLENLTDLSQPVKITMRIHGALRKTGKRQVMPADLFVSREQTVFTSQTRSFPVLFSFPSVESDVLFVELPSTLKPAALPGEQYFEMGVEGSFNRFARLKGNTLEVQRRLTMNGASVPVAQYPALRDFYRKVAAANAETMLLESTAVQQDR